MKTNKSNERKTIKVTSMDVQNVRVVETKNGTELIFLTLVLNGVTINNCRIASGSKGDFVSFPQYKGSNDKYYNYVYAPLSDEDTKTICDKVQEIIDNQ